MERHEIPQLGIAMREIDLSKGDGHNHPDIGLYPRQYLALIYGGWFVGSFNKQWYGLNFDGWYGVGMQFDTPGSNGGTAAWERLIELDIPESMQLQNYVGGEPKEKEKVEDEEFEDEIW